jgi:hypothetical protein
VCYQGCQCRDGRGLVREVLEDRLQPRMHACTTTLSPLPCTSVHMSNPSCSPTTISARPM